MMKLNKIFVLLALPLSHTDTLHKAEAGSQFCMWSVRQYHHYEVVHAQLTFNLNRQYMLGEAQLSLISKCVHTHTVDTHRLNLKGKT